MAVNQPLLRLLIRLAVEPALRQRFDDPAQRAGVFQEVGVNKTGQQAINNGDEAAIDNQVNTQIVGVRKPSAKKRPAKRAGQRKK